MADEQPVIKVRRHTEAERVIFAGAPRVEGAADAAPAVPALAGTPASSPGPDAGGSATADAAPEPREAGEPFRETTLADIESSSMPAVQKGIIVGAVLLIVACIAWYVLFAN